MFCFQLLSFVFLLHRSGSGLKKLKSIRLVNKISCWTLALVLNVCCSAGGLRGTTPWTTASRSSRGSSRQAAIYTHTTAQRGQVGREVKKESRKGNVDWKNCALLAMPKIHEKYFIIVKNNDHNWINRYEGLGWEGVFFSPPFKKNMKLFKCIFINLVSWGWICDIV